MPPKRWLEFKIEVPFEYVEPVADTFAYCLMKNHFHLLVRVKTDDEQPLDPPKNPTQQCSNFFNTTVVDANFEIAF